MAWQIKTYERRTIHLNIISKHLILIAYPAPLYSITSQLLALAGPQQRSQLVPAVCHGEFQEDPVQLVGVGRGPQLLLAEGRDLHHH